ncbi:MAG: hypothetical protein AABX52_00045 [Nanoarchaeota archaeon]
MEGASRHATILAGISMGLSEQDYKIPIPNNPVAIEFMHDPFNPAKEKTLFIVDHRMGSVIQVEPSGVVVRPDSDLAKKLRYMRNPSQGGFSSSELTNVYKQYNVVEIKPESSMYNSIDPAILRAAESNVKFGKAMGPLVGITLFTKLDSKDNRFQDDIIAGNLVFQGKRGIGFFDDRIKFWKDLSKRIESRRQRINQPPVSSPLAIPPQPKLSAAQERAVYLRQRARLLLGRQR